MGAPVRLQKAVPGSKENAAVERREANAQRHWACAARRLRFYPRLSALRSPHVCEGSSPLVGEGMEMPGAPRALREQGRRSFDFFSAGFRNGPEGVNPLITRLAAGLVLP